MASVSKPSRIFPGEGFMSKLARTARARLAYSRMSSMKRSPTSPLIARLMSSCSTPHSSGNSERIVRAPNATSRSEVCPIAGFADKPENPSEPPHFRPTHRCERSAGSRCVLSAFTRPSNVRWMGSAFTIKFCQFCHLLPIKLWRGETQLLFECLLQVENVAVFAEDQRDDQPIIAGTDLSI